MNYRRVLCAVCDNTNETVQLCDACRADPANVDWCEPSDSEQTAEDVDTVMLVAGGQRLESIFGGARKFDTSIAERVVRASRKSVTKRRRRRNANGKPLRGHIFVEQPLSLREIAQEVGCSVAYVHKVLERLFSK